MAEPLFVYGWLLPGGTARSRIDPYIDAERTAPATVQADQVGAWPHRSSGPRAEGELVWFLPEREEEAEAAVRKLSKDLERGFELRAVVTECAMGAVTARLFRWRGPRQDFADYLDAAERKIAIAEWELENLDGRLSSGPGQLPVDAPVPVQADFEGVLNAFDSAVDQVADALRLGNRGSAEALPDLDHCARSVKSWLADRRVVEVAGVRNDATHAYYDKRPQGELWHLWSSRRGSPVDRGDILSFARRAVVHLRDLRPLLECMRRSVQRDVGP